MDALSHFTEVTRDWFTGAFAAAPSARTVIDEELQLKPLTDVPAAETEKKKEDEGVMRKAVGDTHPTGIPPIPPDHPDSHQGAMTRDSRPYLHLELQHSRRPGRRYPCWTAS